MKFFFSILVILHIVLMLLACGGTKPSNLYTLSFIDSVKDMPHHDDLDIGIHLTAFPQYLKRAGIVSFATEEQIVAAEYERWAEPLDDAFIRALAENLSAHIPSNSVQVYPWRPGSVMDVSLTIEVLRFEPAAGDVRLIARWNIFDFTDNDPNIKRKSTIRMPANSEDYNSIVAAMSDAVEQLSKEIAAEIKRVHNL